MPGAGSLTAANHIYGKATADGLSLAMFASSAAMEPLLGNKAAQFDNTRFSWIGSMSNDVAYCGVWQSAAAPATFDEMASKETIFGGGAPAAITYQHPMVLKILLGRPVAGPPGIPADRLKALREALTATMKDAEFLTEANKAGLDIDPASVEEVDALLKRFAAFPPEVFRKAQEAIGR